MNTLTILASQSPRRRELLSRLVPDFIVCPADIDETMNAALSPECAVAELSRRKADCVARTAPEGALVIAADTIVVCGEILGKPTDKADAVRMLEQLSGRTHQVMTAVSLRRGAQEKTCVCVTNVTFRTLRPGEAQAYVDTGEPLDKAGAYGIQGLGAAFVRRIEGDYYGVMGLPVCMLHEMMQEF